ncbi:membrane associated eicosanoid/glutathione metabolism-like domain-containing protein [Pochonia chlamydosporia 170]|uniref:Membrane associated eicosanoid/glutathione metabolism-like domain-containing protein n=1 Tax=Pochonia chlamydosporia 170 TaxID=1380566 RepID=A0A179F6W1_METCM|nr:membrane associated eicosanoid/glutathione metabolism-like domain-containing protein [Pochonia chlamydosporia 170]OAQ61206.1 membrane associated eicosanoid/glutathione metabolism-like domain-containing protein [Pochonia chlamydosporia 170]
MASLLPLDFSQNLSFFTVPAAFGLTLLPHLYAVGSAGFNVYDNSYPRAYRDTLIKDTSIDKIRKQRILRAEACSLNGLETIGLFAASVIAGNYAKLDTATLNNLSIGYLVSRFLYTLAYVFIQNRRLSWLRTAIWQVTAGYIAMFWIKAGYKLL